MFNKNSMSDPCELDPPVVGPLDNPERTVGSVSQQIPALHGYRIAEYAQEVKDLVGFFLAGMIS